MELQETPEMLNAYDLKIALVVLIRIPVEGGVCV